MSNLAGFIKSLLPSFERSDIEADMSSSLESIAVIKDTYASLGEILKASPLQDETCKNLIKSFYKDIASIKSKTKLTQNKNIGVDTVTLFNNAKINGDYILRELSDATNDIIVSQALTAYKANILRAVSHYYFMTRYALDFLNYIYTQETTNAGLKQEREALLNKKQTQFIEKNNWIYARVLAVYGMEHSEFKEKIEYIKDITLPKDKVDDAIGFYDNDSLDLFSNIPPGFIGSPIYSIRLAFTTWEADRYKNMKDKRRLLELRYLNLRLLKENGQSDVNTEREILHIQKRMTDLDYSISKIEESVED